MNLKELEKIIKLVEKANINQLKLEEEGVKIEITKEDQIGPTVITAPQTVVYQSMPEPIAAPAPQVVVAPQAAPVSSGNEVVITSPMVGTFYSSSSPDAPAFVKVGDILKKGDPVCIIEAMKLFNEIESEYDGTVVKVLVKNEEAVEFGQPLIVLSPR